jgi:hypothetical protein
MMATKKQQERKKKARESKARARVEARRHKLGIARQEELRGAKLEKRFREKIKPVVNNPEARQRLDEAADRRSLRKLERNAEILKALEDEYLKEKESKRVINEQLESEGHHTLKDKIGALEEKARSSLDSDGTITIDQTVEDR